MKPAIIELHEALLRSGLSDTEADFLAARFLEEEAELYCECMQQAIEETNKRKEQLYS